MEDVVGNETKVPQVDKIVKLKKEDVNLTSKELGEASAALIEFLGTWEHTLWAKMARMVHMPTILLAQKTRVLKAQFSVYPLLAFEEDINITKAMGDWHEDMLTKKKERIGYIDFAIVVICGNTKVTTRTGVFVRMVLDGKDWLVNVHSMNRRFDPKLADQVNAEEEELQRQDAEEKEEADGGS